MSETLASIAVSLASVGRQLEREGNPAAETVYSLSQEAARASRVPSVPSLTPPEREAFLRLLSQELDITIDYGPGRLPVKPQGPRIGGYLDALRAVRAKLRGPA